MAVSTLNKILAAQMLRRGDGILALPDSRPQGAAAGRGRTSLATSMVKLEKVGLEYNSRYDTCVKAFVRLLAAQQAASG